MNNLKDLVGKTNLPRVRLTKSTLDPQTGAWTIDSLNDQFYIYQTEEF